MIRRDELVTLCDALVTQRDGLVAGDEYDEPPVSDQPGARHTRPQPPILFVFTEQTCRIAIRPTRLRWCVPTPFFWGKGEERREIDSPPEYAS